MKNIRLNNVNNVIIGQLNINSIRNKFENLKLVISTNVDIFLVSETKINESFPENQFKITGYSRPYRLDRNEYGGGLLLYVREDIPSKMVRKEKDYEAFFVEINLKKQVWLLCCSYNPKEQNIDSHLTSLQHSIDAIGNYDRLLLLGDFNCEITKPNMSEFLDSRGLSNLINKPTCFKNPINPRCIDLMLTNYPRSFHSSDSVKNSLSDFHNITVSVLKTTFEKCPPKRIKYRCYKNFEKQEFELQANQIINSTAGIEEQMKNILDLLNRTAPIKTKVVRGNDKPFMTKALRKAIMHRSRLKNIQERHPSYLNKLNYNRQRNRCLSMLRTTRKRFYESLDEKRVTDNKKFWKTIKPFFSNKGPDSEKISLIENEDLIRDDKETAKIFNEFFIDITKKLNLTVPPSEPLQDVLAPPNWDIHKFNNHPSIIEIKKKVSTIKSTFKFKNSTKEEVKKIINGLNPNKSEPENDLPAKLIKLFPNIFADCFSKAINDSFSTGIFPNISKLAVVTPVYKKNSKTEKSNYRPVSILPVISKIYERVYHNQISEYFDQYFDEQQCGFRKGYSTQTSLIPMEELWKLANDKNDVFGALLIDLSKAFDCMSHELLIAKISAYGFDDLSTMLIKSYLSNRQQRTKVGNELSEWLQIKDGVPQGSILGPLLFNIYISDLFLILKETKVANYADDTTPYTSAPTWIEVKGHLSTVANSIFTWLSYNQMVGNADKCQLITNKIDDNLFIMVKDEPIFNTKTSKITGVDFDNLLTFTTHIENLCKKASLKISALARMSAFLSKAKRRYLMNAFIKCHFSYCPLIWMFHSRALEQKINRLHERCLRIVYSDRTSTFEDLLELDKSSTFHQRAIQFLAIELFKAKLSESNDEKIFNKNKSKIKTRKRNSFRTREVESELNGKSSLAYLGPKIWSILPNNYKTLTDLDKFKKEIKQWKPSPCPCRNCRTYIAGVGFID